jgi:hypothetical protein
VLRPLGVPPAKGVAVHLAWQAQLAAHSAAGLGQNAHANLTVAADLIAGSCDTLQVHRQTYKGRVGSVDKRVSAGVSG